jgi:hypothetical protein
MPITTPCWLESTPLSSCPLSLGRIIPGDGPAGGPQAGRGRGLSRFCTAALLAMAYDERFAVGLIGSSGQGGAKIMRRDYGEKAENVATAGEYHWMAGNYRKYAGPKTPADLPVDAHELVALCAPRPVFVSVGSERVEGTWIDSKGDFLGAAGGRPGVRAARQKGPGHQRVAEGAGRPDRRRHRLPAARGRAHRLAELADVPRLGGPVPEGTRQRVNGVGGPRVIPREAASPLRGGRPSSRRAWRPPRQ